VDNNLRPLTLGEILDRTAQLYRNNFWLFAGIFSFYAGVWLVFGLLQLVVTASLKGSHAFTPVTVGFTLLMLVAAFLLSGAAIAAISRAVAAVHLNQPMTIREAYASALPKLGRYVWLMTLTYLRAWVPLTIFYALVIGAAATTVKVGPQAHAAGHPAAQPNFAALGVIVAGFLLMVPAFVFGMWMHLRYSLAVPASMMEDLKAGAALKRSVQLSKGARGRILVMFLLVAVIKIGLALLTQSFVFVAAFKHPGQPSPLITALSQVVGFITNTVLGPIGATALTLFYYDQRVRNEGYDIEWMMRAAGMGEPAVLGAAVEAGEVG
jgi:hypothetical protein